MYARAESGVNEFGLYYGSPSLCHCRSVLIALLVGVTGKKKEGNPEKLVFVTGTHIPQRVQVKAIGTETTSPVRVYTRAEIDRTGQFTTQGILAQDPSVRIIGNGSH